MAPATNQWRWPARLLAASAVMAFVIGPWVLVAVVVTGSAQVGCFAATLATSARRYRLARAAVEFIRTGGGELDEPSSQLEPLLRALHREPADPRASARG